MFRCVVMAHTGVSAYMRRCHTAAYFARCIFVVMALCTYAYWALVVRYEFQESSEKWKSSLTMTEELHEFFSAY